MGRLPVADGQSGARGYGRWHGPRVALRAAKGQVFLWVWALLPVGQRPLRISYLFAPRHRAQGAQTGPPRNFQPGGATSRRPWSPVGARELRWF
jgi:hypothetical protein